MNRIKAALLLALVSLSACAVDSEGPSATNELEQAATSQAPKATQPETPLAGFILTTTYYSNANHTTQVGRCTFRTCPPKGTTCTGTTSPYFTEIERPCIEDGE